MVSFITPVIQNTKAGAAMCKFARHPHKYDHYGSFVVEDIP